MAVQAYYNEVDAYAAEWIRNLIAADLITAGDVDTRSVVDVRPSDLRDYGRCHFFAGIGVWDYALGLAGWPSDRPIWTGSCPCQPFSTAGRRGGTADERHLWPAWHHLIAECRPATVLGEQVAGADGLAWLDLVHADMDGLGYAFGAADLCAAGVGAPHIRQRLWFVADAECERRERWGASQESDGRGRSFASARGLRPAGKLGDPSGSRLSAREYDALLGQGRGQEGGAAEQPGRASGVLADSDEDRRAAVSERGLHHPAHHSEPRGHNGGPGFTFWSDCDWIPCRDGKARPVEPGTFPLAHGAPSRVGRLRAYGNAIVAPVAATFIAACLDALPLAAE